jgi:hypothetical protein
VSITDEYIHVRGDDAILKRLFVDEVVFLDQDTFWKQMERNLGR